LAHTVKTVARQKTTQNQELKPAPTEAAQEVKLPGVALQKPTIKRAQTASLAKMTLETENSAVTPRDIKVAFKDNFSEGDPVGQALLAMKDLFRTKIQTRCACSDR